MTTSIFTDMDSSGKLAAAIILQALKEAQNGNQDALQWILEAGTGFSFWCQIYGVDPGPARDCLKKAIETCLSREQRRELILKALQEHPGLSHRELGRRLEVSYETVRQLRMKLV